MEPNDLPIVCIPLELPAEAAAELLQFLTHLTETIERHYFGELHRLAQQRSAQNRDPDYSPFDRSESDPPFLLQPSLKNTHGPGRSYPSLKTARHPHSAALLAHR